MKKIFLFFAVLFISGTVFGVGWPQEEHDDKSVISYFGQNIGGKISTSLIFNDPSEVKAVKDGKILIIMTDINDDSEFFPSTLGTSIILSHEDDLISVYANLETNSVIEKTTGKDFISEGEIIGETGNSGWQKDRSCLEFQLIDNQKSTAINPKILLPRTENEIDYVISGVMLQNKDGKYFDLRENKVFPSGQYKVYQARNKISVPYKTAVTINGVVIDEISFDTVGQANGKLYVTGKKKYTSSELYPDDTLLLLGEAMLTPGRSTLGLSALNFLGKTKQVDYILSIY
ncbi:MAG: M23 family metallopeptidase [Treponema sp.]|nr:M23 family metallopeptidase [Treponema sp.]